MARFEDIVDIYYSTSGDFVLGPNGDLMDTVEYNNRGFLQRVLTRIKYNIGDWTQQPELGTNLSQVLGKQNNRAAGERIKNSIRNALVGGDLLRPQEFQVDVLPVAQELIAVVLVINPARSGGQIVISLTYDMRDNQIIPRNII